MALHKFCIINNICRFLPPQQKYFYNTHLGKQLPGSFPVFRLGEETREGGERASRLLCMEIQISIHSLSFNNRTYI